MSITVTAVDTATPEPLRCPVWCQPQRCVPEVGESALHAHLIGEVARVRVVVERIDDYDASYRPRAGKPRVNVYSDGEMPLSVEQVDELSTLLALAKVFVAGVAR